MVRSVIGVMFSGASRAEGTARIRRIDRQRDAHSRTRGIGQAANDASATVRPFGPAFGDFRSEIWCVFWDVGVIDAQPEPSIGGVLGRRGVGDADRASCVWE
jgi:hypothetical protein